MFLALHRLPAPIVGMQNEVTSADYSNMSASDLLLHIKDRNKDPVIDQLLDVLSQRLQNAVSGELEAEKRSRTIVISGVQESSNDLRASERARDLRSRVDDIMDVLDIDCCPSEILRIGKASPDRPRLVKVIFPSTYYWQKALANSYRLRNSPFSNIFIRKSMTTEERRVEYELRQQAKELNAGKPEKEWVVYRGQLKRVSELPSRSSVN